MEGEDEWWARDKLQHLVACFLITLSLSFLLAFSRYSLLRRWSLLLASVASLSAGAAKEAADEFGLWGSAGASLKDAAADAAGVLLAFPFATCCISIRKRRRSAAAHSLDPDRAVSMV